MRIHQTMTPVKIMALASCVALALSTTGCDSGSGDDGTGGTSGGGDGSGDCTATSEDGTCLGTGEDGGATGGAGTGDGSGAGDGTDVADGTGTDGAGTDGTGTDGTGGVGDGGTDGGGTDGGGTDGGGTDGGGTDGGGTDGGGTVTDPVEPEGVAVLGQGTHDLSNLVFTPVADATDGLRSPRDMEFDTEDPNLLWIVSHDNESMIIVVNPGQKDRSSAKFWSFGSVHFMAKPSALAFGAPGTMATIHETDELTQGSGPNSTPPDFMGPTLQSTNLQIYDAGHGSHLDMLHNSPNGMGIAWERDNVYWVFDGYHASITRYDFKTDHGPGGADHSDGDVARYVEGQVSRVEGVSSHMAYDPETNWVYIADNGNSRIAVLDASTGTPGGSLWPNYDGCPQYYVDGATMWDFATSEDSPLLVPSGMALYEGLLYISDNETSQIIAFDLDGEIVDWVDTGLPPGSIQGINFGPDGNLYVADTPGNKVWRMSPVVADAADQ